MELSKLKFGKGNKSVAENKKHLPVVTVGLEGIINRSLSVDGLVVN